MKNAESLETVTHTHTHTHTHLKFREIRKMKTQKNCVYLRYKDGLCDIVCLFCVSNTS